MTCTSMRTLEKIVGIVTNSGQLLGSILISWQALWSSADLNCDEADGLGIDVDNTLCFLSCLGLDSGV